MSLIVSSLVSGIAIGSMYGLLALGYHVTWSVSRTVNFAQGSAMMLGAVFTFSFAVTLGWPMPAAIPAALVLCAIYGLAVERIAVRPFASRGSESWLMATVAAGILVDNVVMFTFGREPRAMPSLLPSEPIRFLGTGVLPLHLLIPVVGIGLAIAFWLVSRRTLIGKAMLAVVQNTRAARLMGIDVDKTISATFLIGGLLAGAAGLIYALYQTTIWFHQGFEAGLIAFTAAVMGGIGNLRGAVIGGILIGVIQQISDNRIGPEWTPVIVFAFLVLVMVVRPRGLIGEETRQAG